MKLAPSAERLQRDLDALAEIGRDPAGGITRLALSPEDARARAYVRDAMRAQGLMVAHDEVGNLIGRRPGKSDLLPPVMTGSHLDSVPRGGRYDGPLGVVGALEALRALDEAGVATARPIDVVVFTGEEGSRFARGTIGSAAMSGEIPVEMVHLLTDKGGVSFHDALVFYGDEGPPRKAALPRESVHAYLELHIEQGGVLESRGVDVGAVTAIAGLVQHVVNVVGDSNHAGATPMDLRKDALAGAAEIVLAVERTARELGGVATVGRIDAEPGAFNIIPGAARMWIDARAADAGVLDSLDLRIRESVAEIANRRGLRGEVTARQRVQPGACDERVIAAVERAAAAAGLTCMRMPSGAIHDALHMASFCPSGMLFVPSRGGKSHCPEEETPVEQMVRGITALAHALAELGT